MSLKEAKDGLRAEYKIKRAALDAEIKRQRDAKICERALSLVSFRCADYVLMYSAQENEICVDSLAKEALRQGKKVAFPVCDAENHTMSYHFVSSLSELSVGTYGIREPDKGAPSYSVESCRGSAICFVPGLVFDTHGYRVGYGKGYYDRFLSGFCGSRIGIVYSDFILPEVPRGRYDERVDMLIGEKGVKLTK